MSRYATRLRAALAELDAAGIAPGGGRSPLWRLARRAGVPIRPPHYHGLVGTFLHYLAVVAPLIGAALWMLVWRHDDVRLISLISPTLQMALLPTLALTLMTRIVARWHRLSAWHALDAPDDDHGGADDTDSTSRLTS